MLCPNRHSPLAALTLTSTCLAVVLATAAPAQADVDIELRNGAKVRGQLGANREADVFRVHVPADSDITIQVKGRKQKGQSETPVVDFELLNDADRDLAIIRRRTRTGAKLKRFPITTTAVLRVRVFAASELRGAYQLAVSWKPLARTTQVVDLTGGSASMSFLADGASTAKFTVKAAKGSAALPRLSMLLPAQGVAQGFAPPKKANAKAHKAKKVLLTHTGNYQLQLTNGGAADGLVNVVVKTKTLKKVKGFLELGDDVLGSSSGTLEASARGALLGPAGGSIEVPDTVEGIGRTRLDVPAGAVPGLATLLVGSAPTIGRDPDDVLEPLGSTVRLLVRGGELASDATLTLAFPPERLRGEGSELRVVRRDEKGNVEVVPTAGSTFDVVAGTVSIPVREAGVYRVFGPTRPVRFAGPLPLTGGDTGFNDRFGEAVALSGDTVVIGAFGDDPAGLQSGSAYVLVRDADVWSLQQKLLPDDGAPNDAFGDSVAIDGDTVAVAAPGHDVGVQTNAGAIYVFRRTGDTWALEQTLTASDAQLGAAFGSALALKGDTLLIGARLHDVQGSSDGAAYVFRREGTTWTEEARLAPDKTRDNDQFGSSVALDGGTALIGAPLDDDEGEDAGAAYVFTQDGGGWSEGAKIAPPAAAPRGFGGSAALNGGFAVVGASPIDAAGAAYVFVPGKKDDWDLHDTVRPADGASGDRFGSSIALVGRALVIGSPEAATGGIGSGAVYAFARGADGWDQTQKIALDADVDIRVGASVDLDDETILIGAPESTVIDTRAGAAFSLDRED